MEASEKLARKREIQIEKYQKEYEKWKYVSKKNTPRFYIAYLILILCLAYMIDELATNVGSILQLDVINTFFPGAEGLNQYTLLTTVLSAASIFTFFIRTLADKYGRKTLLVVQVIGLAVGMFFCYFSSILGAYAIGLVFIALFVPSDMQIVYILETSSKKNRAINLAITKSIGILGITLVPILRRYYVVNDQWRNVFLIPAIIGLVIAILILAFVQESDVFIKNRLKFLKEEINSDVKEVKKHNVEDAQGGIINGVKYMFKNTTLVWLFLIVIFFSLCAIGQSQFSYVMGTSSAIEFSDDEIMFAITFYPIFCAIVALINGVVSDKVGRKIAVIFSCVMALAGVIFFVIGVKLHWDVTLVGMGLGFFIGGFQASLDTSNVMVSEQSPTNLRSSILSIVSVAGSIGSFLATGILLLFNKIIPNCDVGLLLIFLTAPALAAALIILFIKIPETRGTDYLNFKAILKKKKKK